MKIKKIVNSEVQSVTYYTDQFMVDPTDTGEIYGINTVLLTHGHFDHIYGLNTLIANNPGVKIYTNEVGATMIADSRLNLSKYTDNPVEIHHPDNICIVADGDKIEICDGITAKAIFTPGHNPSCITWEIGDALFTGDAYIPGIKTVTNLPGGNKAQSEESIRIIEELSNGKHVYPGHSIDSLRNCL